MLKSLTLPLIILATFPLPMRGKEKALTILKVETTEKSGFIHETSVQFELAAEDAFSKTVFDVRFDGTLRAPDKAKPEALIATNHDESSLGFNMRVGTDIYNVYFATTSDGSATTFPSLNHLIANQIKATDSGLNENSIILTGIEGNRLNLKYIGKEISPNYFEFHVFYEKGKFSIDVKELKKTLKSIGL